MKYIILITAAIILSNVTCLFIGYTHGEKKDEGKFTLRNESGKVVAQGRKDVTMYVLKMPFEGSIKTATKAVQAKAAYDAAAKIIK